MHEAIVPLFYKSERKSYTLIKNIRLLRFLLRVFKHYKNIQVKKRVFLCNMLINTILSLLELSWLIKNRSYVLQRDIKSSINARLSLVLINLFFHMTSFRYKHILFNKPIFQERHRLFQIYSKVILYTLYKASFIKRDKLMITKFYGLNNLNLSAQFLVNYIILKLGLYFAIAPIIKPLIRRLKRVHFIDGFRFIISGRLTRKERAAYIYKSHKAMPLSTYKAKVDYAYDYKIMKFGVVGIKILLLFGGEKAPCYYFFEFRDKL